MTMTETFETGTSPVSEQANLKQHLNTPGQQTLRGSVEQALNNYFAHLEGAPVTDVYMLTEKPSSVTMPDLRFKSLREAMAICNMLGLKLEVEGEGYVYAQSIEPGDRLLKADSIRLVLKSNAEIYEGLNKENAEDEKQE